MFANSLINIQQITQQISQFKNFLTDKSLGLREIKYITYLLTRWHECDLHPQMWMIVGEYHNNIYDIYVTDKSQKWMLDFVEDFL